MGKGSMGEIQMIHSLKKKIEKDGELCSKNFRKQNTWKQFNCSAENRKIVLWGAGDMFEYFCKAYSGCYEVLYVVDKNASAVKAVEKNGIPVVPLKKLLNEKEETVVLVTVINGIDEIFMKLRELGIQHFFSLPLMEYHRMSIRIKVWIAHVWKPYTRNYQQINKLEQKIENMEQRMKGIQQRQTERYLYLLHTNKIVNALIDKSDDIELKKEQMKYLFTEIYKNLYVPDFDHPKTYNEKLLAMTLYDHNPLYTEVSDKYLFKQYVAEKVGKEYVVPLLGVWDAPEDIDFSILPKQFVLKATRGGDSRKVILVKDKDTLDINETIKKMQAWNCKYENDYYYNFNWPYKNIKQRFIAEELLDVEDLPYYDFKVHCFHGEPKYIHVVSHDPHEVTYFDTDWKPQEFEHGFPLIHYDIPKPECLEEMLDLSRRLSESFDYVRVDFYVLKDKLYLGELTLTMLGGLAPFEPVEVDYEWGKLI